MSKRIKPKSTIETRAQFDSTVDQICKLQVERDSLIATRDEALQTILEQHNPDINSIEEDIEAKLLLCEKYATIHRDDLYLVGKSADTNLGLHGFRTGNPTLALLNKKWKWKDVLAALKAKGKSFAGMIRTKEEPDKEALKKLDDAKLASIGCRIKQEETFFIEPKRDNPERIQAES